jgi:hypothetical protein
MMLNPWIFGLESVHQAWQAQSEMTVRMVRLLGWGFPDPTTRTVALDIKAQKDGPATVAAVPEPPAAIVDVAWRNVPKTSRVSKRASRVKPRIASKRAAAASGLCQLN